MNAFTKLACYFSSNSIGSICLYFHPILLCVLPNLIARKGLLYGFMENKITTNLL